MEQLSFNINDGEYEGPLDLILHLITKHQVDIVDINISHLLEQYMEQINMWQQRNLEVASEFLEMASRLVYIKTVSLLPKHKEEEEKAKAELVGQLLEYQACKQAALLLVRRNSGFDRFVHPGEPIPEGYIYTRHHSLESLVACYWNAIGRGKRKLPPSQERFTPLVAKPVVSVSSRIVFLLRHLYSKTVMNFYDLFRESKNRSEVVATFLAMLELVKSGRLSTHEDEVRLNKRGRDNSLTLDPNDNYDDSYDVCADNHPETDPAMEKEQI